jgi:glycosyltransferase involved in cell wall biosynthesis
MQKSLIDSGIAEERTIYHPNTLPGQNYNPRFGLGEYVLFAGRLSKMKGIWTMISVFERAKIPLRIAGTGPLEAELPRQAHERGLRVETEGYCAVDPLAELNGNSAFPVAPSESRASFVRYGCSTAIIPILSDLSRIGILPAQAMALLLILIYKCHRCS